jgi:hypothetical protein
MEDRSYITSPIAHFDSFNNAARDAHLPPNSGNSPCHIRLMKLPDGNLPATGVGLGDLGRIDAFIRHQPASCSPPPTEPTAFAGLSANLSSADRRPADGSRGHATQGGLSGDA